MRLVLYSSGTGRDELGERKGITDDSIKTSEYCAAELLRLYRRGEFPKKPERADDKLKSAFAGLFPNDFAVEGEVVKYYLVLNPGGGSDGKDIWQQEVAWEKALTACTHFQNRGRLKKKKKV